MRKLLSRCGSIVVCVAILALPSSVFAEVAQGTNEHDVVTVGPRMFGETVHMQASEGAQSFTVYPSGEFQFQSYGRILNGQITNKEIRFGSLRIVVASKTNDNAKQQTRIEYSMNGKKVNVTYIKGATIEELLADKEFYQLLTSFNASGDGRITAELGAFLAAQRGQLYASGDHQATGIITCNRAMIDAGVAGAIAAWSCSTPVCGPVSLACCIAATAAYLDALEEVSTECTYNPPVRY